MPHFSLASFKLVYLSLVVRSLIMMHLGRYGPPDNQPSFSWGCSRLQPRASPWEYSNTLITHHAAGYRGHPHTLVTTKPTSHGPCWLTVFQTAGPVQPWVLLPWAMSVSCWQTAVNLIWPMLGVRCSAIPFCHPYNIRMGIPHQWSKKGCVQSKCKWSKFNN